MRLRTRVVFGLGYLLGTRAGTDTYHQLVDRGRAFLGSDLVRGYIDRVQAWAAETPGPDEE